jgi:hypothetical protein
MSRQINVLTRGVPYVIAMKEKLADFTMRIADAALLMECGNEVEADRLFNQAVGQYFMFLKSYEAFDRVYNMGLAAMDANRQDFCSHSFEDETPVKSKTDNEFATAH